MTERERGGERGRRTERGERERGETGKKEKERGVRGEGEELASPVDIALGRGGDH